MLDIFTSVLELRKEIILGITLSVIYITYYLVEAVKVPVVICSDKELRTALRQLPVLSRRYWPTPWCVEARAQTVLGSLLRSAWLIKPPFTRRMLTLHDGGTIALDWLTEGEEMCPRPRCVLVMFPGLTGSVQADYVRCIAGAARRLRARLVLVNYRGMGGAPLTSPRLYSAVSHSDAAEAIQYIATEAGAGAGERVVLLGVGVSLGGLVLGQYLARAANGGRLHAALIISSPLDVVKGMECIERRPLNALLSWHCALSLRRVVTSHATSLRDACDWRRLSRVRSVRAFDDAFTTKHFGFDTVEDYYNAATLKDKLHLVSAPLLCLCAGDDPFQPVWALPPAAALGGRTALAVTARGGHIGFLQGWWPAGDIDDQYITQVTHQYFDKLLSRPDLLHTPPPPPPPAPASQGSDVTLTAVADDA